MTKRFSTAFDLCFSGEAGISLQRLHDRRGCGPRLHPQQEDQERSAGSVQLHPRWVSAPPARLSVQPSLWLRLTSLVLCVHLNADPSSPQWWERRRRPATPSTSARATTKCTASARWTSASSAWKSCGAPAAATPRRNSEDAAYAVVGVGRGSTTGPRLCFCFLLIVEEKKKSNWTAVSLSFPPLPVKFIYFFFGFHVTDEVLLSTSLALMHKSKRWLINGAAQKKKRTKHLKCFLYPLNCWEGGEWFITVLTICICRLQEIVSEIQLW